MGCVFSMEKEKREDFTERLAGTHSPKQTLDPKNTVSLSIFSWLVCKDIGLLVMLGGFSGHCTFFFLWSYLTNCVATFGADCRVSPVGWAIRAWMLLCDNQVLRRCLVITC